MSDLYKKLKVHVVTDNFDDSCLDCNRVILLEALELLKYYESLSECSNVLFNKKRLTATSKGRLLSLKILSENITWEDLLSLNDIKKCYTDF